MRIQIGSLDLTVRRKAQDLVTHLPTSRGWFNISQIKESFAGAWQRSVITPVQDSLQHPTFWSCVTLISSDIAKCCFYLTEEDANGIYNEVEIAAFSPVLRRPNHYQNRIQFNEQWAQSKLCHGNTLVLKGRDGRGIVDALYILDWTRCKPLVSPQGQVYYSLSTDSLAADALDALRDGTSDRGDGSVVVPAREVIHDRWNTFYHPLVGLSPIYAAGHLTLHGLKIVGNSMRLAAQGFQPGGVVTSAEVISQDNIDKFEKLWQDNYAGPENTGKIVVLGGGLKFEKPPVMTAVDAEIIKQLNWDDEKICSVFHVPGFMVNVGPAPSDANVEGPKLRYYSQCLQIHVESMELCYGEGLGTIDAGYEVTADVDEALLRMDSATRMKIETDAIKGGISTVNEGRAVFNKKPVKGGDTVYLQEQDHSVAWLAERDAQGPPPPVSARPPAPSVPAAPPEPPKKGIDVGEALALVRRGLESEEAA